MADTPSNMIALGTKAPQFSLIDTVSGNQLTLQELKGKKGTLLFFICNHCPFVKHVNSKLVELAKAYSKQGISFIAISSNDVVRYPADAPELMKKTAIEEGYPFPYLYDETQEVAKAYDAACTPDFYLFDTSLKLVYRGQLDDSRPGNGLSVTGTDIAQAMDALIHNNPVNTVQKPSIGCSIKWKN